jgi:hypothetical protein
VGPLGVNRRNKNTAGRGASKKGVPGSVCTAIVLLDQEPLRKKAAAECTREMARLERLRAEWARFEKEDQPLFSRWMAHTFGPSLTKLREGGQAADEKSQIIEEVELVVLLGGARNHREAYKMVLERRAAPAKSSDNEDADWWEEDPDPFEAFTAAGARGEDEELLFHEFLEIHMGLFAEDISRAEYKRLFAKFKREVLGQATPPPKKKEGKRAAAAKAAAAESPGVSRLKEIYRQLVRRLHPDARTDAQDGVGALWHEVQEAYEKGDLDRLERLFALCEVTGGTLGAGTSLSQMGAALLELRRSIQAMLRSLSGAKKDIAWKFSQTPDRSALKARVERDLDTELARQQAVLAQMDAKLASWVPKERRPGPRRRSR